MNVNFVCHVGAVVPNIGVFVAGQDYDIDRDLAVELEQRGLGHIAPPKRPKKGRGVIDLSDGVSDEEASLASRALSERKQEG